MNRVEIGERLRIAREDCMYSRQKAANYADVGTTTLQQWETGSREASIETIGKLAREYGVTPQYLIFGDENDSKVGSSKANYTVDKPDDEYDYIPAYDVEVSAGNGAVCLGEATATKHLAFRKQWLNARGLNAKSLAALFTKGDSMTPTIPESAVVVINRDHTTPLDGKVYVIRIEDRHYVKRIQWLIGGGLRLISDNKFYDPLDITKADMEATNIEVCGQVIHASYDLPD
ncbi:XRE family transcriptional regulator [Psychrobacter sp. AT9]|uniref:XRE family transcriptional regulator n=1 Tax=Psychrobacter sp. AT9 TaxID=3242893 RepID=UPI0039A60BCB